MLLVRSLSRNTVVRITALLSPYNLNSALGQIAVNSGHDQPVRVVLASNLRRGRGKRQA